MSRFESTLTVHLTYLVCHALGLHTLVLIFVYLSQQRRADEAKDVAATTTTTTSKREDRATAAEREERVRGPARGAWASVAVRKGRAPGGGRRKKRRSVTFGSRYPSGLCLCLLLLPFSPRLEWFLKSVTRIGSKGRELKRLDSGPPFTFNLCSTF